MSISLEVKNFVKSYDNNTVIKGISFRVKQGEIFALLGVNGAGKTTTLECIEGLRSYDSGTISLNGSIGVQLQSSALPDNIKPLEAMKMFGNWVRSKHIPQLVDTFHLHDIESRQYMQLSTGQKRRLHLALALINDPDILFLDEPTAGLDVQSRVSLHDEIRKLRKQGKTIIMASHDMAEVESLCDRLAILKDGRIAFMGTSDELTRQIGQRATIYIKTDRAFEMPILQHSENQGYEREYVLFSTNDLSEAIIELLQLLKRDSVILLDMKIERATLEERFIDIAEEKE